MSKGAKASCIGCTAKRVTILVAQATWVSPPVGSDWWGWTSAPIRFHENSRRFVAPSLLLPLPTCLEVGYNGDGSEVECLDHGGRDVARFGGVGIGSGSEGTMIRKRRGRIMEGW